MSLYNSFGEESLREGARSTRPPPSYLTLTLTLTRMKMYKSNDQISITLSLSLPKYLDLIFFFALPRFACAIVTFAAPRYACLLFTRAASRYVPSLLFLATSICVRWIVVIPSHDLFFYSLSRLPKSGQKPPKSAKSSFSRKACVCFSPSFSVRFW